MKFLTFGDAHQDTAAFQAIVARAAKKDVEFLIVIGDISNFGRGLRENFKRLQSIGKKVFFIPGNHEESLGNLPELIKEFPNIVNFHREEFQQGEYLFLGYGGGGFAMKDPEFRKIARRWYGHHQGKKLVLVTHGPPYGTKIDLLNERHVGNMDYRVFIERIKPNVVICGHLHETAGVLDKIGKTKLIHPGWEGMVIELK